MSGLTDDERERLMRCIAEKRPLGREWLEKLFPPENNGEFFWRGKTSARAMAETFLASLASGGENDVSDGEVSGNVEMPQVGLRQNPLCRETLAWNELSQEKLQQEKLQQAAFAPHTFPSGENPFDWRGLLFKGDNRTLLHHLLQKGHTLGLSPSPFALIYIDPPFFVGTDFHARVPHARIARAQMARKKSAAILGPQPMAASFDNEKEIFAYSDTWEGGKSQYFSMLYERIILMRELLRPTGLLCVHCDWRAVAGLRLLLDECFGPEGFVNEIIWHYTGGGRSKQYFSRKHDSILVYAKGSDWTFNIDAIRVPYKKTSGYAKAGIVSKSGKRYMPHPKGTPLDSVWDIPMVNPMAKERVAYATQKPLLLLERIISALSNEGDLIGDFFCGSGTTLLAGLHLGRRVIGCDFGEQAVAVSRERLLESGLSSMECEGENALPFHLFFGSQLK